MRNWKKYALEFLSIFIAVILAFALNNWNDNRRDRQAEDKILDEILNGLEKDISDVQLNIYGHKSALKSSDFWMKIIVGEAVNLDSIEIHYFGALRDFISIQNTSGYETLKSRGLELITDDDLRTEIISLYEYDYKTLKTLEEDYFEMQFHENYFKEINDYLAPYFQYGPNGNIIGMSLPIEKSLKEQNKILSYFWKIRENRAFILDFYAQIELDINSLIKKIEQRRQGLAI